MVVILKVRFDYCSWTGWSIQDTSKKSILPQVTYGVAETPLGVLHLPAHYLNTLIWSHDLCCLNPARYYALDNLHLVRPHDHFYMLNLMFSCLFKVDSKTIQHKIWRIQHFFWPLWLDHLHHKLFAGVLGLETLCPRLALSAEYA